MPGTPELTPEEEDIIEEQELARRDEVDAEIAAEISIAAPPVAAHVMLDLETWGTGVSAVPIAIGACKFDADTIIDNFHVAIDPASAQALGLKIDANTILWWMDPERDEARRRWLGMQRVDLASALTGFSEWLGTGTMVTAIWGNGSTFDNVILRTAYEVAGIEYPVRFWQDYCYRTVKQTTDIELVREGTHHDALDDAISQAKHLQRIAAVNGLQL